MDTIPALNTDQMREVDRLMINCYGISLQQMMENAGRNLTMLSKNILDNNIIGKKICIAVGNGNNEGSGLVAARHLSNWGAEITILVANPEAKFKPIPARQLETVQHSPISFIFANHYMDYINWNQCDLIIDAILGYGLNQEPEFIISEMIQAINSMQCPIISLDTPSGLHTTNGASLKTVVRADATLSLALPKTGLINTEAKEFMGDLYLGDISVPPLLYSQMGIKVKPLFEKNPIIRYF
jgi:NAD(P)H-hydrate epimerase